MTIETRQNVSEHHPTSPASTSTLDHDILRTMFTLNADMFASDQDAFRTTFRCSHVCKDWRNVIVHDPLLWSGLVDLDILLHVRLRGAREVLKRTKGLPLRVKASEIDEFSLRRAVQTLGRLWVRIEKLVIRRITMASAESPAGRLAHSLQALWDVFSRPTPLMKHFDVDFQWLTKDVELQPLFGDYAPKLWHLNTAHCIGRLSRDAPSFRGLQSIHFSLLTTDFVKVLGIVQNLPRLHSLSIEYESIARLWDVTFPHASPRQQVKRDAELYLFNLRELRLKAGALHWLLFTDRVPLPLTCAFLYTNAPDDTFHFAYDRAKNVLPEFAGKVFERYPPTCMALLWDVTQYEILFTSDADRGLELKSKWPPISFTYLPPSADGSFKLHILLPSISAGTGILAYLTQEPLDSVTLLKISLRRPLPNAAFLWDLKGVRVLQADFCTLNVLAKCLLSQDEDLYEPAELLPCLDTIRVVREPLGSGFRPDFLVEFLQVRHRLKMPVRTLDFSRVVDFYRLRLVVAVLEAVPDLDIFYGETERRGYHQVFNIEYAYDHLISENRECCILSD